MIIVNRILAIILGLVLLIAGLITVINIVLGMTENKSWLFHWHSWYKYSQNHFWSKGPSLLAFFILLLLGLVLLILEIKHRKNPYINLKVDKTSVQMQLHRSSAEKYLANVIQNMDGIASAKVSLSEKKANVVATTHRRKYKDLSMPIRNTLKDHLEKIPLEKYPSININVKSTRTNNS